MTRILCFADTQLGVNTVDLQSQRDVLDKIVMVALNRKVDLVIHGGDVFEGPVVLPEHLRCFIDATKPLRDNHIPLLVIRGNGRHDMAVRDIHALDILRELGGIVVSDRPRSLMEHDIWPTTWMNTAPVTVVTLPWVHQGQALARGNGAVHHANVNEVMSRALIEIAQKLRGSELSRQAGRGYVLVAHWAISGAKLPSGLGVEEMREPILPWADLAEIGYDAIIGAHIHEPQPLSNSFDKTLGFICGSPQQLNFGEHGEHGCWLLEVGEPTGPLAEFVPIDSSRFRTFNFGAEQNAVDTYDALMGETWMPEFSPGDFVRVRYEADEHAQAIIDPALIRTLLFEAGAARVQVEPQIIRQQRARAPEISEQMSQVDALVQWCEANDVDPEMQHRMVSRLQDWRAS